LSTAFKVLEKGARAMEMRPGSLARVENPPSKLGMSSQVACRFHIV
jgi:hypothetical protein